MPSDAGGDVPTWDGDPSSFESFATSCKWFEASLKDNEKKLAAPKIWQRLSGSAKSVVRHLDPSEFGATNGLQKLLDVLRKSPLQRLPVPDSFQRLERWTSMRRGPQETIAQLLVREEELFVELQQALQRARQEREPSMPVTSAPGEIPPMSESPSQSPMAGPTATTLPTPSPETTSNSSSAGFFEDEMRGYRLLKAAKLSTAEKQHILTLTKNSTHFFAIKRALRTLFADGEGGEDRMPKRTVWYVDDWGDVDWDDGQWDYADDMDVYWNEGSWTSEWSEEWQEVDDWYGEGSPSSSPLSTSNPGEVGSAAEGQQDSPEELRLAEAYTIASEANKTLADAKKAVAAVRSARGYYDNAGQKGSPAGKGKGKGKKGKGKGKSKYGSGPGPCMICGRTGHFWKDVS